MQTAPGHDSLTWSQPSNSALLELSDSDKGVPQTLLGTCLGRAVIGRVVSQEAQLQGSHAQLPGYHLPGSHQLTGRRELHLAMTQHLRTWAG